MQYTGVDLTVPATINLTEGVVNELCVSVSEGQPAHERNIEVDFSVMFGSNFTGE